MGIAEDYVRVTFRMPEELHGDLLLSARQNHRSLNSEMISILSAYFDGVSKKSNQKNLSGNDQET